MPFGRGAWSCPGDSPGFLAVVIVVFVGIAVVLVIRRHESSYGRRGAVRWHNM